MRPAQLARVGYVLGCLLVVLGVQLLAGPGWALIAAGALLAASCLLLVNVDEPSGEAGA